MSTKLPNSFIFFLKKVCQDYQQIKSENENYTKLNAPKLAEIASYHWSHMSDNERQPFVDAAKGLQIKNTESLRDSEINYIN